MQKTNHIPDAMRSKYESIIAKTDAFCEKFLNDEYKQLVQKAVGALCRKRPSPLMQGSEDSWAAGAVHAIGMANFLFDKSQTPHCKAPDIYSFFNVGSSTGQGKSKKIREMLKIDYFSAQWLLRSSLDDHPAIWLVEVNGIIVDSRRLPLQLQEEACRKGLIPYVPGMKETKRETKHESLV